MKGDDGLMMGKDAGCEGDMEIPMFGRTGSYEAPDVMCLGGVLD
jgi:hypothetical protein